MDISAIASSVVPHLPIAIWTTDYDLRLTSLVSGPGLDYCFPSPSLVTPHGDQSSYDLTYVLHPDISAHLRARQGETVSWRTGPDGLVVACVAPLRQSGEKIVGVIGAAVDQGRMHSEIERRQRMEHLLYSVLENVPALVSVLDQDGHVMFANQQYLSAAGKTANDVLGLSEAQVLPSLESSGAPPAQTEEAMTEEWAGVRGDSFQSRRFRLDDYRGGAAGMVLHVASHVTGSRQAAMAPDAMTARCEELLGALGCPAFILDPQGVVEAANEEWCTVLKASRNEVVGVSALRWVEPSCVDSFRSLWQDTQTASSASQIERVVFKERNGGVVLVTLSASPLTSLAGDATATVVLVRRWGDPAAQLEAYKNSPQVSGLDAKILELLAAGKTNAEISSDLCLSRQGLDYRLKSLRKQLDAASRGALVARAYMHGLFLERDWPPRCRNSTPYPKNSF